MWSQQGTFRGAQENKQTCQTQTKDTSKLQQSQERKGLQSIPTAEALTRYHRTASPVN